LVSLGRRVYLSFLFIILVSGGIICSVVDVLQQAWYYIIFILEFYSYIIKAFGFPSCFGHLVFILLLSFIIWLSNILSLSAPQEIYARNVSWALKKSIFTLYDLIIACFCPFSFWPAIELSVLRFTASCYPFRIFKLFLNQWWNHNPANQVAKYSQTWPNGHLLIVAMLTSPWCISLLNNSLYNGHCLNTGSGHGIFIQIVAETSI
jgi:hypothetical protein